MPPSPIHEAVARGDLEEVGHRMGSYMASRAGYTEMVASLLDQGANVEDREYNNHSALCDACKCNRSAVVSLLLDKGKADVNLRPNVETMTPLMAASKEGYVDAMRILIDHQALVGQYIITALSSCCCNGHTDATRLLLERGAGPTIADDVGRAPLYMVRHEDWDGCIPLLEDALSQPPRVHILHKARSIMDAKHAITKAYNDSEDEPLEERNRKTIAAAPAYLKERVRAEEELPAVEVRKAIGETEEGEMQAAVVEYLLSARLPKEVFTELMDMMLPKWDTERKRGKHGRHKRKVELGRHVGVASSASVCSRQYI